MKIKKLIIILIMSLFIFFNYGCKYQDKTYNVLIISNYPLKTEFNEEEEIDLSGLEIKYNNEIINDYQLIKGELIYYNTTYGEIEYMIKYKDLEEKFKIRINKTQFEKIQNNPYNLDMIKYIEYDDLIENVYNGGSRQSNYLVCYNKENYIKTNIYGYEYGINEYGEVISANVNVELPENGLILSGHGTAHTLIKNKIKIGDFVSYIPTLNRITIYHAKENYDLISLISRSYDLVINSLFYYYSIDEKIRITIFDSIRELISLYNDEISFLNDNQDNVKDKLKNNLNKINTIIYEKKIIININEFQRKELLYITQNNLKEVNKVLYNYNNAIKVSEKEVDHVGGFRSTNEIVYYDVTNHRETNKYGYEISVDVNGVVREIGTNVQLINNGFVLSGHGIGSDFLKNNIHINDMIIYNNEKFIIFRDIFSCMFIEYYNELNYIKEAIEKSFNNKIPLYYDTIYKFYNETVDKFNNFVDSFNTKCITLNDIKEINNLKINETLTKINFLLLENAPVQTKAFWHTPNGVSQFNEKSIEGVKALLDKTLQYGFNRIYLNVVSNGKSYYNSSILAHVSSDYSDEYDEYKDYLECFISEAHKRNIEVFTWVQTMKVSKSNGIITDKTNKEWYSIDYYGNICNFYDSTNPEVQDYLVTIYKELVEYGMDGIEHDYIRYDGSNISSITTNTGDNIRDYGYTEYSMNKFISDNNIIGDFHSLVIINNDIKNKWIEFKKQGITDTVNKIEKAVHAINENCIISAAVFGSPSSINTVMQDWPYWYENSLLDELEPMIYYSDNDTFYSIMDKWLNAIQNGFNEEDYTNISIGIGPELDGGTNVDYAKQIAYIQSKGLGYSIFSSTYILNDNCLCDIYNYINKNSVTPNSNYKIKAELIIDDLNDKISNYYSMISNYDFTNLKNLLIVLNNEVNEININNVFNEISKIEDEKIRINIYNVFIHIR